MAKRSRVNSKEKTKKQNEKINDIKQRKEQKPQTQEVKHEKFSLYLFLEIERNATPDDIKKQYRKLVLKYHPDKNPSPQAKQQFQKLKQAYDILSDPQKRKIYDETGTLQQQDHFDQKSFQSAYEYFRGMFKKVTQEDINEFAKSYRFGKMQQEDLLNFYNQHQGDMVQLIESIPLSQNDDVPRFIEFFEKKIKQGELEKFVKFNKTKGKVRLLKDETEEFEVLKKQEQKMGLVQLALAIRGKKDQHLDFLAVLQEKYGGEGKKKKVQKTSGQKLKKKK